MMYLLRLLLLLQIMGLFFTIACAHTWIQVELHHISIAIPLLLYTIFAQAFIMFYLIGVSRLCANVYELLVQERDLGTLFEAPPQDLTPYREKSLQYARDTKIYKSKAIPWTGMILLLGALGFLMGGAADTGVVEVSVHSGLIYGLVMASLIGFYKQWRMLGLSHKRLRRLKRLFGMSDQVM